jgi:hypothetical protein
LGTKREEDSRGEETEEASKGEETEEASRGEETEEVSRGEGEAEEATWPSKLRSPITDAPFSSVRAIFFFPDLFFLFFFPRCFLNLFSVLFFSGGLPDHVDEAAAEGAFRGCDVSTFLFFNFYSFVFPSRFCSL